MTSTASLSLVGVLVFAALCFGNPLERQQQLDTITLQPFEDMEDEYIIKPNHDADEMTADHNEPMSNAWDDHIDNAEVILETDNDAEDTEDEEAAEATESESWHAVVKRDVEDQEGEEDVAEAGDEEEEEEGSEDDVEHDVEKRDIHDELLEWYRDAIETNSN